MPKTTRPLNGSVARRAIADQDQEEHQEEAERHDHADEAELLADDREDEIGVLLRQEGQPLLGALGVAVAEPAARADRHLDWIAW